MYRKQPLPAHWHCHRVAPAISHYSQWEDCMEKTANNINKNKIKTRVSTQSQFNPEAIQVTQNSNEERFHFKYACAEKKTKTQRNQTLDIKWNSVFPVSRQRPGTPHTMLHRSAGQDRPALQEDLDTVLPGSGSKLRSRRSVTFILLGALLKEEKTIQNYLTLKRWKY